MTLRRKIAEAWLVCLHAAAIAFAVGLYAASARRLRRRDGRDRSQWRFHSGLRPHRNSSASHVLHDQRRFWRNLIVQRGKDLAPLRLAALDAVQCRDRRRSPMKRSPPPAGKEPFGLFTFRAPEGMLWRKWRGIESDIAKEHAVLDHCRANRRRLPILCRAVPAVDQRRQGKVRPRPAG